MEKIIIVSYYKLYSMNIFKGQFMCISPFNHGANTVVVTKDFMSESFLFVIIVHVVFF